MTQISAPVKLGEKRYVVDLTQMIRRPLNSMRQFQDQGQEPGEGSLDNQGVWRRTSSDFILGMGQRYFDQEDESVRRRFRVSSGVDTLSSRRSITTLKKAHLKATISGVDSRAKVLRTSSGYWWASSTTFQRTTSLTNFSMNSITGAPTGIRSMTTYNGFVYVAFSTSGVYRGTVSGSSVSLWSSVSTTLIEVCHGRLLGSQDTEIFELDSSGVKQTIYTHGDSLFRWFSFCAAPNGIYAAGTNGTRCEIHLITVVDATGALAPPIPVAELPAGESINKMAFFGGYIYMATTKGVRIGNVIGSGSVVYGPLLRFGNVRSIHSDGRFAYFTWDAMDLDNAYGIGRLSLERFTSPLVPAYVPDIATTTSLSTVLDVSSDSELPVFVAVDGSNTYLYGVHSTDYEVGKYYSGGITYGTPERKAAVSIEGVWDALPVGANVKVEVLNGIDGTSYGGVNTSVAGSKSLKAYPQVPLEAEEIEVKVTLTPNASTPTNPITFRRWTLRGLPMPFKADEIFLHINLSERVRTDDGQEITYDPREEWLYLRDLMNRRSRIRWEFGGITETVYVDGVAVDPTRQGSGWTSWGQQRQWPNGTVVVRLITVEEGN